MQLTRIWFGALVALGYFSTPSLAQIKIGVAEALTGNAAQYGVPIRKGFELAVSEINGSGGVNGQKIELVVEDEQGKKEEAIKNYNTAISKDPNGVTGENARNALKQIEQEKKGF